MALDPLRRIGARLPFKMRRFHPDTERVFLVVTAAAEVGTGQKF